MADRSDSVSDLVYVVLAAGRSMRMGFSKATAPLAGRSPLARLAALLGTRAVVLVTTAELADACRTEFPGARLCVNLNPSDGMTSSLLAADRVAAADATLGVLLADKPFVTAATLVRCERELAQNDADVLFAAHGGEPGHPVYFRPAARARLRHAPQGDTLRGVRDDPRLRRHALECGDHGVLTDLDTPDDWQAAASHA